MADLLPTTDHEIYEAAEKLVVKIFREEGYERFYRVKPFNEKSETHAVIQTGDGPWTLEILIILRPPEDDQS